MRRIMLSALVIATAAPACALDMPPRKPGLWELKMAFAQRNLPPRTIQQCVDAATDKQMNTFGAGTTKDLCDKQDLQMSPGRISVDSVCKFGTTTTTSHAEVTGSFDSAYTVTVSSSGGAAGPNTMTIEAKWVGACSGDLKPGDIVMGPGLKMNVLEMQKLQNGARGAPR